MDVNRDKNLLLGMLAVQLRGVQPAQLAEAAAAWTAAPALSLAEHLAEKGFIAAGDTALLNQLVEDAVRAHGGDTAATLLAFGGVAAPVRQALSGVMPATNLDIVDTAPMDHSEYMSGLGQDISGVREAPGRYTLLSHHAKGGMGRVLIVHDEHLGRNIALKELMPIGAPESTTGKPTPIRQSASLVARFLQEARITSQLEHPSIVPVYEMGQRADGTLYYTMRLVRGRTLAAALHESHGLDGRLRLLSNFIGLCQAIAYAHSRGVIHRDIKPANIMIGQFGETVVLDWGLAKFRGAEDVHIEDIQEALHALDLEGENPPPVTAYGRALGTPHYMPPEQAGGKIEAIDERSDVYSLGAVLYEMLTGATPYAGKSTRDILSKVIHTRPTPVLAAAPEAPPALAAICEKAMQRDPAARYATAAELAEEVLRFITGSLVQAYRYSPRQILAHYYTKHKLMINTAAACLLFLAATGVYSYINIMHARDREHTQRLAAEESQLREALARQLAEEKRYESNLHLAQAYIKDGDSGRANEALWNAPDRLRGWEWSYLLNQANPDIYTVDRPDTTIFNAVFSPDGFKIGTNTYPEPPAFYDAQTGRELVQCEAEPANYTATLFSPDGALYAGTSKDGEVSVWNTATGKRIHHFSQPICAYSAVFDAAGTRLYVGYGDQKVRIYDLTAGALADEFTVDAGPVCDTKMRPGAPQMLTVADGTGDGQDAMLQLWDLPAHTLRYTVRGVLPAFSPDGARLAALQGSKITVWDAETGTPVQQLPGHDESILSLQFNRDGARLLSASADGSAILWDVPGGRMLRRFTPPGAQSITNALFTGQGGQVLVCTDTNHFFLYDAATGACLQTFRGRGQGATYVAAAPNGSLFALTPGEHQLQAMNPLAPTGVLASFNITGRDALINPILTAPTASPKFTVNDYQGLLVLDAEQKACLGAFSAPMDEAPRLPAWDAQGRRLALLADNHSTPVVVDNVTGEPTVTLCAGQQAKVIAMALSPGGETLATGDRSGDLCLWQAGSGREVRRWRTHDGEVTVVQCSGDGRQVLTAGADGAATLWSVDTGEPLLALEKQDSSITAAALSPDGERIFTMALNGAARVWNGRTGTRITEARLGANTKLAKDLWGACGACFLDGHARIFTHVPHDSAKLWRTDTLAPLASFPEKMQAAPLAGGAALALVNPENQITVLDIPDGTGSGRLAGHTREVFGQYQQSWRERSSLATTNTPPWTQVFISAEDLSDGLTQLADSFANPAAPPGAPGVLEGQCGQAVALLLLRAGDTLQSVDGAPAPDMSAAANALAAAAGRAIQPNQPPLSLAFSREDRSYRFIYRTLPLAREEKSVALSREEAAVMIHFQLDILASLRSTAAGHCWLKAMLPPNATFASAAQLPGENTTLVAVDGAPCDSPNGLSQQLALIRQRITSENGAVEFSQGFREGLFKAQTVHFSVPQK